MDDPASLDSQRPLANGGSSAAAAYTVRGALSFLESRFHDMERDRAVWNLQRVEFEAQVAMLKGRNLKQESLIKSLVKRIQMLEHALRLERNQQQQREDDEVSVDFVTSAQELLCSEARALKDDCVRRYVDKIVVDETVQKAIENGREVARRYLDELQTYTRVLDIRPDRNRTRVKLDGIVAEKLESATEIEALVIKEFEFLNNAAAATADKTDNSEKYFTSLKPVPLFEEIRVLEGGFARGHLSAVRAVAFHPRKPLLFTGCDDFCVRVFIVREKKAGKLQISLIRCLRGHRQPVTAIEVDMTGVYSGDVSGMLCKWACPSLDAEFCDPYDENYLLNARTDAHSDCVNRIRVLRSGDGIVTISTDHMITCWTEDLSQRQWSFDLGHVAVDACECSSDMMVVALNSPPGQKSQIGLVCTKKGSAKFIKKTKLTFRDVSCAEFMNNKLIIALTDKSLQIYDLNSGQMSSTIDGTQLNYITDVAVRDDRTILTVTHGGVLHIWYGGLKDDLSCCQQMNVHHPKGGEGALCVALHPTLPLAATGGADDCVRVLKVLRAADYTASQQRELGTNGNNLRIGRGGGANRVHW